MRAKIADWHFLVGAERRRAVLVFLSTAVLFWANAALGIPLQPAVILDSSIATVAGTGTSGYSEQQDGGPATLANLNTPRNVGFDAAGNMYIADYSNGRVRKVDAQGIITTYGGGGSGCSEQTNSVGDGCPATSATMAPSGLAVAPNGDVYVADYANYRVRKIDSQTGIISTVAGTGTGGHSGDEHAATGAQIGAPFAVALDSAGNLYIAQVDHRIRKVDGEGIITTIAGTGTAGFSGDDGPAVSAMLNLPSGMAFDLAGNLYFPDRGNQRIRRIDTNGIITTVAGSTGGFSGDGGPATSAQLNTPTAVAIDTAGNIYIADFFNNRIRKIDTAGTITTVVGNGGGHSGDGGPANLAGVSQPLGINFDAAGALYIGGQGEQRIRRVSFAGTPDFRGVPVSSQSAPKNVALRITQELVLVSVEVPQGHGDFTLGEVTGCTVDGQTNSSADTVCNVPVTFTPSAPGTRTAPLVVTDGNGRTYTFGMTGIGEGPVFTFVPGVLGAIAGELGSPQGVAVDGAGHVYVSDTLHHVVWSMNADGSAPTIIAGHQKLGGTYQGDGGPATSAGLSSPVGLALDAAGSLYIADRDNHVVRKVDAAGTISTVVGNGTAGSSPCDEGSAAVDVQLHNPQDVAIDAMGNLYVADTGNHVIRRISSSGIFRTYAGDVFSGATYSGDGGAATAAGLNSPSSVVLDADGNLFIADSMNYIVRQVNHSTGVISTVAGTPEIQGSEGDGETATSARLGVVNGLAVDGEGSLYIAENNHVIRKVGPDGHISTVAGNASLGAGSQDGLATTAQLHDPMAVDVDGFGHLYIADKSNGKLRKVNVNQSSVRFGDTETGDTSASATVTIRNAGLAVLDLGDGSIDNPAFVAVSADCEEEGLIQPGESCSVQFTFSPTASGTATGTARIVSNAANTPHVIALAGTGVSSAASTQTSLAVSPTGEAEVGHSVTLTAVVSASSGTPVGTVTFYNGESSIGSSALNDGSALLETSSLAEGQHSFTAEYAGNQSFLASSSNTVELLVVAPPQQETPDYTLTANPSSLAIVRGQSGQATITLTPLHGFAGTVNLSCGSLPVGVTCRFAPSALVSTGAAPVSSSLVVETTGPQVVASSGLGSGTWSLGLVGIMGMVVMATGRKRRLLAGAFLLAMLMALAGCSDRSFPAGSNVIPTPTGQQTVTVTATGTAGSSDAPQHSVQLNINVTN